jgi:O-antigen/teichoic acid export membrane protein
MLLFGYSLWAWVDFTLREATAIGLGTVMSFLVTGGFTQAIARRGLFYLHQKEDILTKKVSYRFFLVGLITAVALGLLFFLVNLVFEMLSPDMAFYAQLYYFMLSVLWLSFSILYMLRQQLLFTLITAIGIIVVHIAILLMKWHMIAAQSLGLGAAIALSLLAGWVILHRRAKRAEADFAVTEMPRLSMVVYAVAPYFFYGMLYFAFLFADRLIAWSSDTGRGLIPYFIWFDSRYELGMDWALLCFVLIVGVLEFTIEEFSERIVPAEQAARADGFEAFNQRFTRFYYSHLALFLAVSVVSVFGAFLGMIYLRDTGLFPFIQFFFDPLTEWVFWWASAGYVFLVWGLLNSIFLFALSRPAFVLRSMTPALVLNVVVGFILSRAVSYDWAVIGLTVGSLAFMLISGYYARRTFRKLDYFYYSAY